MKNSKNIPVQIEGFKDFVTDPEFHFIGKLMNKAFKGLIFPCLGYPTGDFGDRGFPIVKLENGNTVSLCYVKYAD